MRCFVFGHMFGAMSDYFIDPIESSSVRIFQALTLITQIMPLQKSISPWTQKCMVVKLGRNL
jgi:hypothetical protein